MPKLTNLGVHELAPFQNVVCMANVQHNCRANKCKFATTGSIFQEREEFKGKAKDIVHLNPDDNMLNCVKTRDFRYIGLFSIEKPVPEEMAAIREGAEREVSSRTQNSVPANNSARNDIVSQDPVQQVFDNNSADEGFGEDGANDSD